MTRDYSNKLTNKVVRDLLGGISQQLLKKLTEIDPAFPEIQKIGRSIFIDKTDFCAWQSKKAGYQITEPVRCLNSKNLQDYFNKSHTWIWQQLKSGNLPAPFKVGSLNLWFETDIQNLPRQEIV